MVKIAGIEANLRIVNVYLNVKDREKNQFINPLKQDGITPDIEATLRPIIDSLSKPIHTDIEYLKNKLSEAEELKKEIEKTIAKLLETEAQKQKQNPNSIQELTPTDKTLIDKFIENMKKYRGKMKIKLLLKMNVYKYMKIINEIQSLQSINLLPSEEIPSEEKLNNIKLQYLKYLLEQRQRYLREIESTVYVYISIPDIQIPTFSLEQKPPEPDVLSKSETTNKYLKYKQKYYSLKNININNNLEDLSNLTNEQIRKKYLKYKKKYYIEK